MREDYSEILERMKDEYRKHAGYTPDDASDIGIRMKTLAGEIFSLESSMDFIKRQMFPTTATGIYLDMHAEQRGISRQSPTKAIGRLMFYVERALTYDFTVPAGTVCAVSDGSLRFVTDNDVVLPSGNVYVMAEVHAEQGGSEYNVPSNTVNSIVTYFSESIYVNNTSGFSGGADAESDEELRTRIAESYYNPSNGMNETYYKQLAMSVDGVYSANVWRLAHGTGTVGVFIASRAAKASDTAVSEVQQLMNKMRPLGVDVIVESAKLTAVSVKVSVAVFDGYSPDEVKGRVQTAIKNYFERLGVGMSFKFCDIGEAIYHVQGVKSYAFDTSVTKEADSEKDTLYTLGALTLTVS